MLNGFYIPHPKQSDPSHKESKQYEFRVTKKTDPNNKFEWEFAVKNDDFAYPTFRMYHEDFEFFMDEVLDKNKSSARPFDYDNNRPVYNGTWTSYDFDRSMKANQMISDPNKTTREDWETYVNAGGSTRKHNRRTSRRKPTKRHRNRRGNRKTKKN